MSDYIIRATAADAGIRAFAATTKELVEKARQIHDTSPVITAALGRLLTGGVMMGTMLKGEDDLLTLQVSGDGPVRGMTVTAGSNGTVKGYAVEPQVMLPKNAAGKLDVGGAVGRGTLRVIKDMGLKEPYVGQTALQTGEIADDLTYYFAASEQVPSSVGLGVLMEKNNTVKQAGGFIVQLMPGTSEEVIEKLEMNLSQVTSVTRMLEAGYTPEQLLEQLLQGMEPEILDTIPAEFYCNCSRDRMARALISIGARELQRLIDEGEPIELKCHFCGSAHTFLIPEIRDFLDAAGGEVKPER